MQLKNTVIVIVAAVIVVGGGYLISQNRAEAPIIPDDTNSPTPFISLSPSQSVNPTSPSPTPRITPRVSVRPTTSPTKSPSPSPSISSTPSSQPTPAPTLISYTNTGYHPASIKIKVGTTVVFKNDSTSSMWPASDDHPSHSNYPGSGAVKCGTAEAAVIFDPCEPVQPGESWSFTFNEKGAWRYHDHLETIHKGTITVE